MGASKITLHRVETAFVSMADNYNKKRTKEKVFLRLSESEGVKIASKSKATPFTEIAKNAMSKDKKTIGYAIDKASAGQIGRFKDSLVELRDAFETAKKADKSYWAVTGCSEVARKERANISAVNDIIAKADKRLKAIDQEESKPEKAEKKSKKDVEKAKKEEKADKKQLKVDSKIEGKIKHYREKAATLSQKLERAEDDLRKYEKDRKVVARKIAQTKAEIDKTPAKNKKQLEKLGKELDKHTAERKEIKADLKRVEGKIVDIKKDLYTANGKELEYVVKANASVRERNGKIEAKKAKLDSDKKNDKAKIAELNRKLTKSISTEVALEERFEKLSARMSKHEDAFKLDDASKARKDEFYGVEAEASEADEGDEY